MKLFILNVILFMSFIGSAQKNSFNISGKIGTLNAPARLYLTYKFEGKSLTDSFLLKNGSFLFKGKLNDPVKALLTLDSKGIGRTKKSPSKVIYLDKGSFVLKSDDSLMKVVVKNSKINDIYRDYIELLKPNQLLLDSINKSYFSLPQEKRNDSLKKRYSEAFNSAMEERKIVQKKYIEAHPNSFVSLDALKEITGSKFDPLEIESFFESFSQKIRDSKAGKDFAQLIDAAKGTAIGAMAMNFTQSDTLGKPVSLTDFRGKYVLLDFWASWCGPCRAENPNVVAAFKKYKNKNFTVLGVSLDMPEAKEKWMAAIHKDGLTWTHVSDLQYWDNAVAKLYGIHAIPQNLLIDPSGKIVAKNIRGEELQKKLAEIFK